MTYKQYMAMQKELKTLEEKVIDISNKFAYSDIKYKEEMLKLEVEYKAILKKYNTDKEEPLRSYVGFMLADLHQEPDPFERLKVDTPEIRAEFTEKKDKLINRLKECDDLIKTLKAKENLTEEEKEELAKAKELEHNLLQDYLTLERQYFNIVEIL